MAVTKLPNKKKEAVKEILTITIEQEYDEVLIVGFKDGKFYMQHSNVDDAARVLGTLVMLQHEILKYGD